MAQGLPELWGWVRRVEDPPAGPSSLEGGRGEAGPVSTTQKPAGEADGGGGRRASDERLGSPSQAWTNLQGCGRLCPERRGALDSGDRWSKRLMASLPGTASVSSLKMGAHPPKGCERSSPCVWLVWESVSFCLLLACAASPAPRAPGCSLLRSVLDSQGCLGGTWRSGVGMGQHCTPWKAT